MILIELLKKMRVIVINITLSLCATIIFNKEQSVCQSLGASFVGIDDLDNTIRFYGFPFISHTNDTYPYSLSGELYLYGYVGNIFFWMLIIAVCMVIFHYLSRNFILKIPIKKELRQCANVAIFIGFSMVLFLLIIINISTLLLIDWQIEPTHWQTVKQWQDACVMK